MMTRMEKMMGKMNLYRVYGHYADGNIFDEYCEASSAQAAVNRCREWTAEDGGVVEEVSKVVKSWR